MTKDASQEMLSLHVTEKHMLDSENVIKGPPRHVQIIISQPAAHVSHICTNVKKNVWKCRHPHLWMQSGGVCPHEALNKGQRAACLHRLDVEPTNQLRRARAESSASVRAVIIFVTADARPQPVEHAEIVQNG